ncbi:hypothetical protein B0H14DRAFT_3459968 [Mycena olivaceomarginata]|nr:hypothetical protein B0H14DRAFT_3459968 [Mycena olivaceomarginata]
MTQPGIEQIVRLYLIVQLPYWKQIHTECKWVLLPYDKQTEKSAFHSLAVIWTTSLTLGAVILLYCLSQFTTPENPHLSTHSTQQPEMAGTCLQIVIGLGASWIGRTFGLGQVIDYQEMHDLLINRAAEFDRSKLVNNLFAATLPQGMLALPTDQQFKHHKRYLGITIPTRTLHRLAVGSSTEVAFNALDDIRLSSIDVIAITFGTSFDGVRRRWNSRTEPLRLALLRPPPPNL